ncbi:MAG: porin [Acidobacteria bacterium]|nr:porin [Acidobacteriota bacterium]
MKFALRTLLIAGALFQTASLMAQTPPAQPTPDPAPAPAPPAWSAGPIDFSGLVDAYYSLNFNHPASTTNNLRNFDVRANQFSLNMAKLELQHAPDPVGFRIDLGFGRAWDVFHSTEPLDQGRGIMRVIPQAYMSVKPASWKGFQIDVGKFYTSAGAELTETHLNFNYSRALLYANGPYYHMGIRTSMPVNKWLTVGFQVLNGWNNVEDNNSGKTVGFTTAMTGKKVSWFNTYLVGPEKAGTNDGVRHFWDTVLNLNPSDKASFYINYDYGVDKIKGGIDNEFWGIGFAHKYAVNSWFAISPRIEYYNDKRGFITLVNTGSGPSLRGPKLKEFTLTGECKMKEGFLFRAEFRRDWSDLAIFDRGNELGSAKNQTTVLVGFVAYFGPKR